MPIVSFVPIPKLLLSDSTGHLLTHCLSCDKELIASQSRYLIEKSFVRHPGMSTYETVFEYAICLDCAMAFRHQMSSTSLAHMDAFFEERLAQDHRNLPADEAFTADTEPWFSKCALSGTPVEELKEYQVIGICEGDQILFSNDPAAQRMPLLIDIAQLDALVDLLSPETKDEMDRFRDNINGVPPEWEELFKTRPILV